MLYMLFAPLSRHHRTVLQVHGRRKLYDRRQIVVRGQLLDDDGRHHVHSMLFIIVTVFVSVLLLLLFDVRFAVAVVFGSSSDLSKSVGGRCRLVAGQQFARESIAPLGIDELAFVAQLLLQVGRPFG